MILHKLPPFQNVGAGLTAVLPQLPLGMTYYGIRFKLGGTFTKAQIDGLRVRLGGKLFVDVTGSHLDDMVEYLKGEANASYITLYFAEPVAKTVVGEYIGAVDTSIFGGNTAFELEVDINGAAVSPTLSAWAMLAPPKGQNDPNKATIRALLKATHSIAAAGEFTQPIPLGSIGGAQIKRIFAFHGGNVTKIQVKKDGLFLVEEGEIALLSELQDEFWREEQANLEVVDYCMTNNQSDVVATLRRNKQPANFEHKFTTSAADTIITYSDIYTTIDRV